MQNKAKVKIGKMNLTLYQKTPYEQNTSPDYGKSPKTKPNKAKVKMGKMNLTLYHEKDYKKRPLDSPKNKPKQTQSGLFAEALAKADGEGETVRMPKCSLTNG